MEGRHCFVDLYVNICVFLNDFLYSLCLYLFFPFGDVSMSAGNAYDCVLCVRKRGRVQRFTNVPLRYVCVHKIK